MNEPTPRKVERRVVKRTVVRPASAPPSESDARSAVGTQPSRRPQVRRPQLNVGAKVGRVSGAAASGVGGAGRAVGHGASAVWDAIVDAFRSVLAWRIPHIDPVKASVITGVVCAAFITGIGAALLAVAEWLRGTTTFGGFVGFSLVVAIAVLAWALGAWLLNQFGVRSARAISVVAVLFTITIMLLFFLNLINTAWALLIVPSATVISYIAAERLIEMSHHVETY